MADIRKRKGAKGTTYQVRYATTATKCGYAYKTFATRKEALAFRDSTASRRHAAPLAAEITAVAEGVQKWLDICEKEGRNGREPVTKYTLANYQYRADIMKRYPWDKELRDLTKPDIIHFRSWLLEHHSRDVAHKVLTSFHSMIREMVGRGVLLNDIAAGGRRRAHFWVLFQNPCAPALGEDTSPALATPSTARQWEMACRGPSNAGTGWDATSSVSSPSPGGERKDRLGRLCGGDQDRPSRRLDRRQSPRDRRPGVLDAGSAIAIPRCGGAG